MKIIAKKFLVAVGALCMSLGGFGAFGDSPLEQDGDRSGKGDIYYAGDSDEEFARVVRRALDQLSQFQVLAAEGDDKIMVRFDDSNLLIDCKATDEIDRLCVSVLFGCKASVRSDDPQLLLLMNGLNGKYNHAKFAVHQIGEKVFMQVQGSLPFINFMPSQMSLAWFEFFEDAVDMACGMERRALQEFLD